MTNEEALKITEDALMHGRWFSDMDDFAYVATVYNALEKQVPKRAIDYDDDCGAFTCPNCSELIYAENSDFASHKHCLNCGQAIDWSEECTQQITGQHKCI